MLELSTPIKFVKRVGERVAEDMAKRGVETVEDLLYHLPFRYEDRLNPLPMSALVAGTMSSVIGEVRGSILLRTRSGPIFEMTLGQGLGSLKCMWFNGAYLKDRFKLGQMVAVYGKLEQSRSGGLGKFKMIQPQFEILPAADSPEAEFVMLEMGRIVPVYESLGGTTPWGAKLTSRWLRRVLWGIFEELEESRVESKLADTLPATMRERLRLPGRLEALRTVHFPAAGTPMTELMSFTTPGHKRLIFEELFYLELGLELKRRRMRERVGTKFETNAKVREAIKQVLPFHPTGAQKRVLGEIAGRHAADAADAAVAAGGCGFGQDDCGDAGGAGGDGEWLPGGADGSDGDSGDAALSFGEEAVGWGDFADYWKALSGDAADRIAR